MNGLRKVCFVLLLVFCFSAWSQQAASAAGRKLKVGFFVDRGSRGGGVMHWARLLTYSPKLAVTLLDAGDIHSGKLKNFDVLIVPGGSSTEQFKSVGKEGAAKIREYVKNGGNYIGICAGFHCALVSPSRFSLVPYKLHRPAVGRQAVVAVEISKKGAEILGIAPGERWINYASGPIARPVEDSWPHGAVEVVGTARSLHPSKV